VVADGSASGWGRHGAGVFGPVAPLGCAGRIGPAPWPFVDRLLWRPTQCCARVNAEQRLRQLAPRWAHVRGVAAAAEPMAAALATTEAEAVVAAAWLHGVGYAPSVRSTCFHPVDGAAFVVRAKNRVSEILSR
jgi:hypothetical protein